MKAQIETTEGSLDVIDLEVPAVIVVDPGHGGLEDEEGSSWNNATSATGILEKEMTKTLGLKIRQRFRNKLNKNYTLKVLLTRAEEDVNPTGKKRSKKAGDNGADVFLSLHFNGGAKTTTRGTEVWIYPDSPPPARYLSSYKPEYQINFQQDYKFAKRLLDATANVVGSGVRGEGIKTYDYTTKNESPYAKTPSNVYQDDVYYLNNISIPGIDVKDLALSRAALLEVAYITNPDDDQWFNGINGNENYNNLADSLIKSIIDDIEKQP